MAYSQGKKLLREHLTGVFDINARQRGDVQSELSATDKKQFYGGGGGGGGAGGGGGGGGDDDDDDDDDDSWMD